MIPISKPWIGPEEKQAVMEVMDSGFLVQGPRTAKFETEFARVCEVKHAIAVSSGTTALMLAAAAAGLGAGDEVITSPFTFIASINSILWTGAKPVFIDVDEKTFNMDPALIEPAINAKTKAIMPVHLYGQSCDMSAIADIARKHGLIIIEDACQAIGARHRGQYVGSYGVGAFSLYATKNVMCGEGGMITTHDDRIAEKCRLLRNHGMVKRYYHDMLGYNYRTTDLHSAIGLAQLRRLPEIIEKRRHNAEYLNQHIRSVVTPAEQPGNDHVWHQYTIRTGAKIHRDQAVAQLNAAGVGTGVFYPVPAHQQSYIRALMGDICLPAVERLSREVISLPVHPLLTPSDLEKIAAEVNKLC